MTDDTLPTVADLPTVLTERSQWVCWRSEERDEKQTKIPIDPETDHYASTTDSATWGSFTEARATAAATEAGVGFVFTEPDTLVGIDLDDCRDPDTGTLDSDAQAIVDRLNSFTEVSPSGTGVHVIVTGSLPDGRNRHGTVEMYETARFFTVTGDHLSETPATVERRPAELQAVHAEYVATTTQSRGSRGAHRDSSPSESTGAGLSDDELLDQARAAANGEKFARLFEGSTAGYPSQSEADMALCGMLAFWTGGDHAQIDRLVRASGLYRQKWDEVHFGDGATYGERTIERAVAGTTESYEGSETSSWTAFDDRGSTTAATEHDAGAAEPSGSAAISSDALSRVRTELDALEAENERLKHELSTERARRRELETRLQQAGTQRPGLLRRLVGRE